MLDARINLVETVEEFVGRDSVAHALFLTYTFDAPLFEERLLPLVLRGPNRANILVIHDGSPQAVLRPAAPRLHLEYRVATAGYTRKTFHSKLVLLIGEAEALALVGSCNLSRGGLESNLELVTPVSLSPGGGQVAFFRDLHEYLSASDCLPRELASGDRGGADSLARMARDLRFLLESSEVEPAGGPVCRFVHNYRRPLWERLSATLPPDQPVRRALVVSPFFELPAGGGRGDQEADLDPENEPSDGSLIDQLMGLGFAHGAEAPVHFYVQTDGDRTALPLARVRHFGRLAAIWAHGDSAVEEAERRLHAKTVVIECEGKRGRPRRLTLYQGSANFTPSAMLRGPSNGGNAEVGCLLTSDRGLGADAVAAFLGLPGKFARRNAEGLEQAEPAPAAEAGTRFAAPCALYSCANRELRVWFSVCGAQPDRVQLFGTMDDGERLLAEWPAWIGQPLIVGTTDAAAAFVPDDALEGRHRLRLKRLRLVALDQAGRALAEAYPPFNVDFPERFVEDVEWEAASLEERIFQSGLSLKSTYERQLAEVRSLERRSRGEASGTGVLPRHKADLDSFFKQVDRGFRVWRRRLDLSGFASHALYRYVRELIGWGDDAVGRLLAAGGTGEARWVYVTRRITEELAGVFLNPRHGDVAQGIRSACPWEVLEKWAGELALAGEGLGDLLQAYDANLIPRARRLRDLAAEWQPAGRQAVSAP